MQKGHAEELVVCALGLPDIIVLFGFGLVRTGEVRPMMPVEEILELRADRDQQRADYARLLFERVHVRSTLLS
jgi:hypothetical protein